MQGPHVPQRPNGLIFPNPENVLRDLAAAAKGSQGLIPAVNAEASRTVPWAGGAAFQQLLVDLGM